MAKALSDTNPKGSSTAKALSESNPKGSSSTAKALSERSGQKWTEAERKQLVDLLYEQLSFDEIATRMKRSRAGIELQIRNMVAAQHSTGQSTHYIAKACGLSEHDVEVIIESLSAKLEDRVAELEREMAELRSVVQLLQIRK